MYIVLVYAQIHFINYNQLTNQQVAAIFVATKLDTCTYQLNLSTVSSEVMDIYVWLDTAVFVADIFRENSCPRTAWHGILIYLSTT